VAASCNACLALPVGLRGPYERSNRYDGGRTKPESPLVEVAGMLSYTRQGRVKDIAKSHRQWKRGHGLKRKNSHL
jgi:hypothetical protein